MADKGRIAILADLPVEVEVAIRAQPMRASEILGLRPGDLLTTPLPAGMNLDVYAGKARIGTAELATTGGRSVIRMAQIGGRS